MFSFEKKYSIKNEVAALIPLEQEHAELLFEASHNKELWRHFTEDGYGKSNFNLYIKNALQNRKKGKEYPLVIKDLRANEYAGMTRMYEVSNELKNVKIGHTWIGEKFQGTGLNKNCKYLLFEFLFDQMKMKRIGFGASAENLKSIQAMKSVGCTQEGVLRSFLPGTHGGQRIDIVLMSILYEEWDARVREELKRKIKTKYGN